MDKYIKILSALRDLQPEIQAVVADVKAWFSKKPASTTQSISTVE